MKGVYFCMTRQTAKMTPGIQKKNIRTNAIQKFLFTPSFRKTPRGGSRIAQIRCRIFMVIVRVLYGSCFISYFEASLKQLPPLLWLHWPCVQLQIPLRPFQLQLPWFLRLRLLCFHSRPKGLELQKALLV